MGHTWGGAGLCFKRKAITGDWEWQVREAFESVNTRSICIHRGNRWQEKMWACLCISVGLPLGEEVTCPQTDSLLALVMPICIMCLYLTYFIRLVTCHLTTRGDTQQ